MNGMLEGWMAGVGEGYYFVRNARVRRDGFPDILAGFALFCPTYD